MGSFERVYGLRLVLYLLLSKFEYSMKFKSIGSPKNSLYMGDLLHTIFFGLRSFHDLYYIRS